MQTIYYLQVFICLVVGSESRGPHHPRGGQIVKKHVHYRPTKDHGEKLIQDENLLHDKEHIQEHLEEVISEPDLANLTDEQLEFYYFQIHDTDKNNKLDGLEILQAIYHVDHHDHEGAGDGAEEDEQEHNEVDANVSKNYYVELIDEVLKEDDTDGDGYLSYPEYVAGRQKKKTSGDNKTPSVKMIP